MRNFKLVKQSNQKFGFIDLGLESTSPSLGSPCLVCKTIEKLMRDFLWEGVDEGKGAYLVNWDVIRKSVDMGGLELEILRTSNKPLLGEMALTFPS